MLWDHPSLHLSVQEGSAHKKGLEPQSSACQSSLTVPIPCPKEAMARADSSQRTYPGWLGKEGSGSRRASGKVKQEKPLRHVPHRRSTDAEWGTRKNTWGLGLGIDVMKGMQSSGLQRPS